MQNRQTVNADVVKQILRMSQKALACTLLLVGMGYIGGLIAIFFKPDLADALQRYANIFTPVWSLEIGMYGIGSTLENVQKIKNQISAVNDTSIEEVSNG